MELDLVAQQQYYPSWANLAFSPGRSRCPENLCGAAGEWLARVAAALWRGGWSGAVLVTVGGRGWENECRLPVTPGARGMRARNLAWRGDPT